MSSDRLLSHKAFDMALQGTPVMEVELQLDGAGTEGVFEAAPGSLLMIQNIVGVACFVSVGATAVESASEPSANGVLLSVGEKLNIFTKEGRSVIRAIDNGTATTVRVFSLS